MSTADTEPGVIAVTLVAFGALFHGIFNQQVLFYRRIHDGERRTTDFAFVGEIELFFFVKVVLGHER